MWQGDEKGCLQAARRLPACWTAGHLPACWTSQLSQRVGLRIIWIATEDRGAHVAPTKHIFPKWSLCNTFFQKTVFLIWSLVNEKIEQMMWNKCQAYSTMEILGIGSWDLEKSSKERHLPVPEVERFRPHSQMQEPSVCVCVSLTLSCHKWRQQAGQYQVSKWVVSPIKTNKRHPSKQKAKINKDQPVARTSCYKLCNNFPFWKTMKL